MLKMKARPVCVHCGKAYGRRVYTREIVRWDAPTKEVATRPHWMKDGKMDVVLDGPAPPPPPYKGNGIVINQTSPYLSAADGRMTMDRSIWDGESYWHGYSPFCTLRCALDYARKAYIMRSEKNG